MVHTLYNFSRLILVVLAVVGLFGFFLMIQGRYWSYFDYSDVKERVDICNNTQYSVESLNLGENIKLDHLNQYGNFYVRVNNVSEVVRPKAKVLAGGPGKSVMNFSGCSVEVQDVVLSLYTNVDGKEVFLQRSYIDELGFRSDTRPLPDERDYNMSDVLSKAVKSYQIDNFGDVRVISLKRASEIRDEYEFFKYDDLTFEDNVFVSKDKGKNWLKVVYPFRIKYFDDSLGLRKFEDIIVDASIPRGSSEDVSLKIRRTYVSETGASMGVGEVEVCFRPKYEKRRFAFLSEQEDSFTFYGMCEDKLPDL